MFSALRTQPLAFHQPPTGMFATTAAPPQRHALVLNWEDVLMPISLLAQRIGLHASRQAMEAARAQFANDAYLQQSLASIEEQTIALLTTAATIGPVIVITEKSLKFMEVTCGVFFPRLAGFLLQANMPGAFAQHRPELHRIHVVAPPCKFNASNDDIAWRSTIFQSLCVDQVQRDAASTFSLISVSTTERDAVACVRAASTAAAPLAVPKCVQISNATQPQSLETFFAQLQTLQQYLSSVAIHPTAFSSTL